MIRRVILSAILLEASVAFAEPADSSWARRTHLPISEFGVSAVFGDPRSNGSKTSLHLGVGDLRRIGKRTFVGAEVGFTLHGVVTEKSGWLLALRPRIRHEIGRGWAADLAAGPIVAGQVGWEEIGGRGVSAVAGIEHEGIVGASVEVDTRRVPTSSGGKSE